MPTTKDKTMNLKRFIITMLMGETPVTWTTPPVRGQVTAALLAICQYPNATAIVSCRRA